MSAVLSLISIDQRVGVRYEKDQLEKKDKAPGNFNWYVDNNSWNYWIWIVRGKY